LCLKNSDDGGGRNEGRGEVSVAGARRLLTRQESDGSVDTKRGRRCVLMWSRMSLRQRPRVVLERGGGWLLSITSTASSCQRTLRVADKANDYCHLNEGYKSDGETMIRILFPFLCLKTVVVSLSLSVPLSLSLLNRSEELCQLPFRTLIGSSPLKGTKSPI
jgi:hypothetical protein